jgi:hypothetical protein
MNEQDFERGRRSAYASILRQCMIELAPFTERMTSGGKDQMIAQLVSEREAAIVALREICAEHGDNDWPDNLYLADIIEKHLGRNLDTKSVMDERRAREVLGSAIENDDMVCSLGTHVLDYCNYKGMGTAGLDGNFTADQLEAIAWWMRNKAKPDAEPQPNIPGYESTDITRSGDEWHWLGRFDPSDDEQPQDEIYEELCEARNSITAAGYVITESGHDHESAWVHFRRPAAAAS